MPCILALQHVKHRVIIWPSIFTPRSAQEIWKHMSTMYENVHSGIIHNSQEVEMTHMSMMHEWIKCSIFLQWDIIKSNEISISATTGNVVVLVAQSYQSCDPLDCSLPGSSVHGILQARILEWIATPFSSGSSQPRDWTWVSRLVGRSPVWATREEQL